MWSWLRKVLRLEHEHSARVVRVQHVDMPAGGSLFGGGGGGIMKATVVLYFCDECKISQTQTLIGTWSEQDVKGIDASAAVDNLLGNRPPTKAVD